MGLNLFSPICRLQRLDHSLKSKVTVRRFVKGLDEPALVELINAEYREYTSWWRGITVEEMFELEKSLDFDLEGRFVAEIDGRTVGGVHIRVEGSGEEKRGFTRDFCVLSAFRGSEVEERLLEAAVTELRKRGVKCMHIWTGAERADRIRFLEKSGFRFAYRTFDMRISLVDLPSDMDKNVEAVIRPLNPKVEVDIETLNWLDNECFKDNPIHVPRTVEETRRLMLENPFLEWREFCFAVVDGKDVGFIGLGIDEKYNVEHSVKTGSINGIGVLPGYRKRGIGTQLILYGLNVFKSKGMTSASLDTEDTNPTRAITLYEKVGFKVLQEYVTYAKDIASAAT